MYLIYIQVCFSTCKEFLYEIIFDIQERELVLSFLAITFSGDGICPQPKNEYNTPNYCEEGQVSCSGGWDVLIHNFNGVDYKIGCKADDVCYDTKRDQCSTFYCPATCVPEAGEYFCPHGNDVNGCPMGPGSCTYRTGEETCPPLCRPRCDWDGGHTLCPHGEDSNGCSLGHHCAFTCGKN